MFFLPFIVDDVTFTINSPNVGNGDFNTSALSDAVILIRNAVSAGTLIITDADGNALTVSKASFLSSEVTQLPLLLNQVSF